MIRFAKAIMVNGHSIACVLLAGYVFAPVMRFGFVFGFGVCVFFILGGETGLINENEGDI
jgi:hypothetical protein